MPRKYGDKAQKKVEKAMHERKRGTLRSGRSGKKVTSRKQAIAIGLSEARRAGGKGSQAQERRRKKEEVNNTGLKVRDVMTSEPACCVASTPLPDVARLLVENDCGAIPVVDDLAGRRPIGIVTDRDIACRAVAERRNALRLSAGDCMSAPCLTTDEETPLEDCCRLMEGNRVRRIVIVDASGRCTGILAQADVARRAPAAKTADVVRKVSQPTRSPSALS